MAKPEQLNTSVTADTYARFSTIAAGRSVSNAALLRDLVEELIEAHDAGRAMFQSEAAPRLDSSVSALVHQLREAVVELDRAQADNARMLGKLTAKWNGGEEAARAAQEQIWERIRKQDTQSLDPFKKAVSEILDELSQLPDGVAAILHPQLARITEQLGTSNELASQPRQLKALILGENRMLSLAFLCALAVPTMIFCVLIGLMLPQISESWSAWQARKLIDGPAQMCRVVNAEYGTDDCQLPAGERDLGLRIIAREQQR